MSDKNWDDMSKKERANLVRFYLIDKGYSYGQLAAALNVTRNTIAGICNREGIKVGTKGKTVVAIPGTPTPPTNIIPFPVAQRPEEGLADMAKKLKAKRKNSEQSMVIAVMAARREPPPDYAPKAPPTKEEYWHPIPESQPVSIEDANSRHCRWPVSPDNKTWCGCRVRQSSVYCDTHHALAYRPAPEIKLKKKKAQYAASGRA